MRTVKFLQMRMNVISAVHALSDPIHQRTYWSGPEKGVNYYDDLDVNVHVLYDDCMVLPSPEDAVPEILHEEEVEAFCALDAVFGPVIRELGDRPDEDYLADPRWESVVAAARSALATMVAADQIGVQDRNIPKVGDRLTPKLLELVARIATPLGSPGRAIIAQAGAASVAAYFPTTVYLSVPQDAPRVPLLGGPAPTRALVYAGDDLVSEIRLMIGHGRLRELEQAWYTDSPPTEWPDPSQVRVS